MSERDRERSHEVRKDPVERYPKKDRAGNVQRGLGKTAVTGRDQAAKKGLGKTAVRGGK